MSTGRPPASRADRPAGKGPSEELRITLFGNVALLRGDRLLPDFPTAKARDLFSYLVLNRRRLHSRDSLMGVLWGDRPDPVARKNLRTDIWRVRRILEPRGVRRGTYLITHRDAVGFNGDAGYWLDVEQFERTLAKHEGRRSIDLTISDAADLRDAVALYRGDLLEELYDDWCVIERERLRTRLLVTLEKLMRFHAGRREWASALLYGHWILQRDPLREHIHRDVMRYHYFQGDRPAALTQFRTCADLLAKEMDIEPMRETAALMRAIESETLQTPGAETPGPAGSPSSVVMEPATLVPVVAEIRAALREMRQASARLRSALGTVEDLGRDES